MKISKIVTLAMVMVLSIAICGCGEEKPCTEKEEPKEPGFAPIVVEKPVIYLYGYDNQKVDVKLDFNGEITCVYPSQVNKVWSVMAQKDGTLKKGEKEYRYLYWEGTSDTKYDFSQGYCIKGEKTEKFLEESLKMLGMTDKEMDDFITYWLPKMKNNPYNVISFQGEAYTASAKLDVTPSPEQSLRVFMAYYPSDEDIEIKAQKLQTGFSRNSTKGTILVEWGGACVDKDTLQPVGGTLDDFANIDKDALIDKISELTQDELQDVLNKAVEKKASGGGDASPTSAGSHDFTDKNGKVGTFTDEQWNFLQSTWAYTGNPDAVIAQFTIDELKNYLALNKK